MRVVENGLLPFSGYKCMAVLCWIFVRRGTELTMVDYNHECIHWEQEKELLVVGFYVLYVLLFAWELLRCFFDENRGRSDKSWRNGLWKRAYRSVAFEREAYGHEEDMLYRYQRKHFAWIH